MIRRPFYTKQTISTLTALARHLGVSVNELNYVARHAGECYQPARLRLKVDGGPRKILRVSAKLQTLHRKILTRIFHHVSFPSYLKGSIKNNSQPTGHIPNAEAHAGSNLVVREDIKDFFPSIHRVHVKKMWQHLFCFSEPVAEVLTRLTTYGGTIPQGAATSPYIANLLFWDQEPELVDEFEKKGFQYTRYIDDIHVSTNKSYTRAELSMVRRKIRGLFSSKNLIRNKNKSEVQIRGRRITVHNLVVNSGKLTITQEVESRNRAAVKQLEINKVSLFSGDPTLMHRFKSVFGKVSYWKQIDPVKAMRYLHRLKKLDAESPIRLIN